MSKEEGRKIKKVFIVAEMGASHHQRFDTAIDIIKAVKWSGADAVKVQLFTPGQMTLNSSDDKFLIEDGPWQGFKLYDLYDAACLPMEWVGDLKLLAEGLHLGFFATVYHPDMVGIIDVPIYKIASYEITYLDLIETVAGTKKPVFISTGMAEYNEIKEAVKTVRKYHNKITLLHCVSEYPAPIERMNLKTMPALGRVFKTRIGLSDHTDGIVAPVAAVSLGAEVIEKHIRIDDVGLDGFAIMPERFKVMVEAIRAAEQSLGQVTYGGEKKFRREEIDGRYVRVVKKEECLTEKQS